MPFTNRLARWYWRVSQAAPTLSVRDALWVAAEYAVRDQANEILGTVVEMRPWNVWLAYRPWESLGQWRAYTSGVGQELIPALPVSDSLDFFHRPQGFFPEDPKRTDHVRAAARRVEAALHAVPLLSEPHWYLTGTWVKPRTCTPCRCPWATRSSTGCCTARLVSRSVSMLPPLWHLSAWCLEGVPPARPVRGETRMSDCPAAHIPRRHHR